MERKEISEQIGELNLKIFSANKELEDMQLSLFQKQKIEQAPQTYANRKQHKFIKYAIK